MTSPARPPSLHQQRFWMSYNFPGSGFTAGVKATGSITCGTDAAATDGNSVTICDGVTKKTYEYDKSVNGVAAGNVTWLTGTTAAGNATALATLIAAQQPAISVSDNLAGVLTLTNNWPGTGGNVAVTKSGTGAVSAVTGMTGGLLEVATSITADTTVKLYKAKTTSLHITRAYLNLPVGLAQDAANYCNFKLLKGASTIVANWSTLTGANGTITADTPIDLVLTATLADLYLADADQLSLFIDITGSTTVPPGRLVVEGFEL